MGFNNIKKNFENTIVWFAYFMVTVSFYFCVFLFVGMYINSSHVYEYIIYITTSFSLILTIVDLVLVKKYNGNLARIACIKYAILMLAIFLHDPEAYSEIRNST